MALDQQSIDQLRSKQLNPHHVEYWRCRGLSADQAKMCASAGENVFDSAYSGPPSGGGRGRQSRGNSREPVQVAAKPARGSSQGPAQGHQPRGRSRGPNGRHGQSRGSSAAPAGPGGFASPVPAQSPGSVLRNLTNNSSGSQVAIETLMHVHGENTARRVTLTNTRKTEVAPLYVSLMIDTSGSMAGSAVSNVMDQSIKMLKVAEKIKDTTKVSVFHFDTSVTQVVHRLRVKDIKTGRMKKDAEKAAARGGRTSLYDAIGTGLDNIRTYHHANRTPNMQYFLTVFTDGGDNASRTHTLETVRQALASPGVPNFNFFVISAGLDEYTKALLDSLATKPNCKHLPAGSVSKEDLDKAFKQFTARMVELLEVKIVSQPGARPAMGSVLRGMQQMTLTGGGGNMICDATLGRSSGHSSGVKITEVPPNNSNNDSGGRGRSSSCQPGQRRVGRSRSRRR